MFRPTRVLPRLCAGLAAALLAAVPLGARAASGWSDTMVGVTTVTFQSGHGLGLLPTQCVTSVGAFSANMTVNFAVVGGLSYTGPAHISATYTSDPSFCSSVTSSTGTLSNATFTGTSLTGHSISCDLSVGGLAYLPSGAGTRFTTALYGFWVFNALVPCTIDGQAAGSFGVGAEGVVAFTGASLAATQATELEMVGGITFGNP
jgi:hypothetical protein